MRPNPSIADLAIAALALLAVPIAAAQASSSPPPPPATTAELPTAGTLTYEEVIARYGDAQSKFLVLEGNDGIRVHYKDEGQGPAVLLVHGTFGDLGDWDGWVPELTKRFRVVRLDLPAFGLTGPVPSGNYSIDRYLTLVDGLMDHLGIERFAIVGTSYGGLVAFRYAATRTERVRALVLANSAGVEYGGRGGTRERTRDPNKQFKPELRTPETMAAMLKSVVNDPAVITPALVARKTDFANLIGRDREAFVGTQMYERGNPERVLGHVRAPALVLWGGNSRGLSVETAQLFLDAMKNSPRKQKIIYPGAGHLLHFERPGETARDVSAFLDRELGRRVR